MMKNYTSKKGRQVLMTDVDTWGGGEHFWWKFWWHNIRTFSNVDNNMMIPLAHFNMKTSKPKQR